MVAFWDNIVNQKAVVEFQITARILLFLNPSLHLFLLPLIHERKEISKVREAMVARVKYLVVQDFTDKHPLRGRAVGVLHIAVAISPNQELYRIVQDLQFSI